MEDKPTDGSPILILMEKPILGCRVVAGRFTKNLSGQTIGVVGGLFTYDAESVGGKMLRWTWSPEIPEEFLGPKHEEEDEADL